MIAHERPRRAMTPPGALKCSELTGRNVYPEFGAQSCTKDLYLPDGRRDILDTNLTRNVADGNDLTRLDLSVCSRSGLSVCFGITKFSNRSISF